MDPKNWNDISAQANQLIEDGVLPPTARPALQSVQDELDRPGAIVVVSSDPDQAIQELWSPELVQQHRMTPIPQGLSNYVEGNSVRALQQCDTILFKADKRFTEVETNGIQLCAALSETRPEGNRPPIACVYGADIGPDSLTAVIKANAADLTDISVESYVLGADDATLFSALNKNMVRLQTHRVNETLKVHILPEIQRSLENHREYVQTLHEELEKRRGYEAHLANQTQFENFRHQQHVVFRLDVKKLKKQMTSIRSELKNKFRPYNGGRIIQTTLYRLNNTSLKGKDQIAAGLANLDGLLKQEFDDAFIIATEQKADAVDSEKQRLIAEYLERTIEKFGMASDDIDIDIQEITPESESPEKTPGVQSFQITVSIPKSRQVFTFVIAVSVGVGIGAQIGAFFGGVGALPGGIIGGIIGGIGALKILSDEKEAQMKQKVEAAIRAAITEAGEKALFAFDANTTELLDRFKEEFESILNQTARFLQAQIEMFTEVSQYSAAQLVEAITTAEEQIERTETLLAQVRALTD